MKREDWDELDRLLGLEGFGGYYDVVECLKDIASGWIKDVETELPEKIESKIYDIKTIKNAINFLQAFDILRHRMRDKQ